MRRVAQWVVMAIAALAGGCGDETGILVRVTAPPEMAPAERLVFFVGVGEGPRYRDRSSEDDVDLGSRDLATRPYRLLVRPNERMNAELVIAAVAYAGGEIVGFGRLAEPVGFAPGVVRSWELPLGPPEGVTVSDTGCLSYPTEDGSRVRIGRRGDLDCDGWLKGEDCDDADHRVHPGRSEACGNAVDDDCDGAVDEDVDEDEDGYTTCGTETEPADCDDGFAEVHPGAEELCDGLDNDCNGGCDEPFDVDLDGFSTCGSQRLEDGTCEAPDAALTDCDDAEPWRYPLKAELCDGLDNDCNQICDDGLDADGDGYNECGSVPTEHSSCQLAEAWVDCAPDDPAVHPAAAETCDGIDENCDGVDADVVPCFDHAAAGDCRRGVAACLEGQLASCELLEEGAPLEMCAAAEVCVGAGASFAECFAEPSLSEVCAVHVAPTGGLCPGADAILLPPGAAPCTWSRLGAPGPEGELELYPSNDPSMCSALLWAEAGLAGPDSSEVYLLREDPSGDSVIYLHLVRRIVDDCTGLSGVECSVWPTVDVQ